MTHAPSPRRYLGAHLPFLAFDAWVEAGGDTPDEAPIAFVEKQANALRLTACCPGALAQGLTPGLTLADARARAPQLAAIARDHAAEAALLGRLLAGAGRYTPMATAEPPDGLMLDITGCTHAFAGEAGLREDWARRLASLTGARLGLGDTPQMARAQARFGGEALSALPVSALEAGPEVELALRRAGLKTIGDLADRPRAPLAARFGDLALRLARLLGEEDARITPTRPQPPLFAIRRFAEPVARVEHALATLTALVADAAVTLEARQAGGRRFTGRFFRSDGAVRALRVETGRPTRDPALIGHLFAERLETLSDPLDPGFGFDLIRLDVAGEERLAPDQSHAPFVSRQAEKRRHGAAGTSAEELDTLTDRLSVRLGARQLYRAAPRDTHIPECASAPTHPVAQLDWPAPEADEPPLRPLQLFDPPEPVTTTAEVPDGPPYQFTWRGRVYRVARAEGPERVAAEWWRRRDRGGLTRDYYRVEDEAGHRFWLFRHGLYDREAAAPGWYIHGLFA